MLKNQREIIVDQLCDDLYNNQVLFLVDYKGLNVAKITTLRRKLRPCNAKVRVVKNTLLRVAREKNGMHPIDALLLKGSSAAIFAKDDPVSTAKTIKDFLKDNDKPQVKAIVIKTDHYGAAQFETLAAMPGIPELRGMVVGTVAAPLYGLVNVLSGLMRGVVTQIDQIAKQKAEA